MEEVWKRSGDMKDGWYEVSNLGNYRRIVYIAGSVVNGYTRVYARRDGAVVPENLHVLVARAFIGDRPAGLVVNHIDGNKQNNRIDNLEYCSISENTKHAHRMGLCKYGDKHWSRVKPELVNRGSVNGNSKLNEEAVKVIRYMAANGTSLKRLAKAHGMCELAIRNVVDRNTWRHV